MKNKNLLLSNIVPNKFIILSQIHHKPGRSYIKLSISLHEQDERHVISEKNKLNKVFFKMYDLVGLIQETFRKQ